jgi:squalene-hopene/tetraprenyl-beta-curcumene cyclase
MDQPSLERLESAYQTARAVLMAERTAEGHWVGELSTSALSTATAVSALALVQKHNGSREHDPLLSSGLAWLAAHQNADGGWGDTVKSLSNISTTMLCRAAFYVTSATEQYADCLCRTEAHLSERYGKTPEELAQAVRRRYGKDRTFSVPILTTCALAGLVSWKEVPPLPFELACLPQAWFRFLRLHVVSYALPALIAIGQAIYHYRPPRNPFTRMVRWLSRKPSLRVLEKIQPSNGGFLEATPLTSFVTLSLASIGLAEHPVVRKAVEFLVNSVRPDGSWPIDTNLATWVTTLSINALAAAGELEQLDQRQQLLQWLLRQQYQERHPYTGADPGGWAWTPLPGGVPDVDDTSGALLALAHLGSLALPDRLVDTAGASASTPVEQSARNVFAKFTRPDARQAAALPVATAVADGRRWLFALQNRDGGWPTFCRGWGHLPFDRSGPDLTAHALRGLTAGFPAVPRSWLSAGLAYLARQQRPDGSWLPLWFGNQYAPDEENPTYGTARVLAAYRDLDMMNSDPARRGIAWLLAAQNADGGWGGAVGVPSSMEETALAVEVLLDAPGADAAGSPVARAVNKGLAWLVEQVEAGGLEKPTPIGFYFAKLWYFEKSYPAIFTVAALGRARRKTGCRNQPDG